MNDQNVFVAPEDTENIDQQNLVSEDLQSMSWERLKKKYYRSCNVSGITELLILGAAVLYFGIFSLQAIDSASEEIGTVEVLFYIYLAIAVFYSVSIAGLIRRTNWGRICGIICCVLALLSIPIGTIIGIAGLFAFLKEPDLFGPGRVTHKELKEAFKVMKAERKRAKKAAV